MESILFWADFYFLTSSVVHFPRVWSCQPILRKQYVNHGIWPPHERSYAPHLYWRKMDFYMLVPLSRKWTDCFQDAWPYSRCRKVPGCIMGSVNPIFPFFSAGTLPRQLWRVEEEIFYSLFLALERLQRMWYINDSHPLWPLPGRHDLFFPTQRLILTLAPFTGFDTLL